MICLEERASEASHVDTWRDYTSQDRKILQASKFMWCFASKLKRCSIRWLKCLKTPCSCVEESISIWRVGNCAKKTCWSSLVIYFAVKTCADYVEIWRSHIMVIELYWVYVSSTSRDPWIPARTEGGYRSCWLSWNQSFSSPLGSPVDVRWLVDCHKGPSHEAESMEDR